MTKLTEKASQSRNSQSKGDEALRFSDGIFPGRYFNLPKGGANVTHVVTS